MRILITNDDGIHALGLLALHKALSPRHEVHVVAPEAEQSAVGHSITLADPIRVKEVRRNGTFFGHALSGTPADCVRLGLGELVPTPIDLVVSGINLGANVGINILYSGTVSAATEAAILGCPALAVSLNTFVHPDFGPAASFAARLIETWADLNLPPGTSLNVNFPAGQPGSVPRVVWARQALTPSGEEFSRRIDPRGNVYYWRGREIRPAELDPDSDLALLNQGCVTLTPLRHDLTNHRELERLKIGPLPRN